MRRREFVAAMAGAAAWPLVARAQQPLTVIGFISSRSLADSAYLVAAFCQGLKQAGFVEGQNVGIKFGWPHGQYERLPQIAQEFAEQKVAVIVTVGGTP